MRLSPPRARRLIHAIAFGRDPAPPARRPRKSAPPVRAASLSREHAGWWEDPNVLGLCCAPKVRHGRVEDLALQVLVRQKRPESRVAARRRIPSSVRLDALGLKGTVPTDVREVGSPRLDVFASVERPAHPGFDIGYQDGGDGTLGCAVRARDTGERRALSCAHVIASYGRALPGERVLVPSLDRARRRKILRAAAFGSLVTVAPLDFRYEQAPNNVDAATVRPDDPAIFDAALAVLGVPPSGIRDDVPPGLPVMKVGAATERTTGTVQGLQTLVWLPFPDAQGVERQMWFTDLIGISSFTAPGDSGSLVLDMQNAAVGLHLGSFDGLSVCMPIRRVLDSVGCDLETE